MHPFSMSERELAAALEALPPDDDASHASATTTLAEEAPLPRGSPARRGALMLLRGILEQRVAAMAATGSAEADAAALKACGGGSGSEALPPRLRAAMLYRLEQKRAAAGYLALVRQLLAEELHK